MDFIDFNLAKKLKEKGFREDCLAYYNKNGILSYNGFSIDKDDYIDISDMLTIHNYGDNYDAPTISQVLKWLREEKHLHIELVAAAYGYNYIVSQTPEDGGTDYYSSACDYAGPNDGGAWDSYEQAVLAGIEYVLDNF